MGSFLLRKLPGVMFPTVHLVIPGPERSEGARNPYKRWWLWIPGSPFHGAPE